MQGINSAFSRMKQNMSWDLQQGNWPQLISQSSICKYRVPCNYFTECREIHAGFCKTSVVTATTACQFWNVMNGLSIAAHTQQLSVCLKIFFAEVFTDITYANYASQENNHGSFTKNILCQKCCTLNSLMQDSGGGMNKKFSGGQKQNAKMHVFLYRGPSVPLPSFASVVPSYTV